MKLSNKHKKMVRLTENGELDIYHDSDGWWVELADGYAFDGEVSFLHEDTVAEIKAAFDRVEVLR